MGSDVVAAVSLVRRGIADKNTGHRARAKFMGSGGMSVRIAQASKKHEDGGGKEDGREVSHTVCSSEWLLMVDREFRR